MALLKKFVKHKLNFFFYFKTYFYCKLRTQISNSLAYFLYFQIQRSCAKKLLLSPNTIFSMISWYLLNLYNQPELAWNVWCPKSRVNLDFFVCKKLQYRHVFISNLLNLCCLHCYISSFFLDLQGFLNTLCRFFIISLWHRLYAILSEIENFPAIFCYISAFNVLFVSIKKLYPGYLKFLFWYINFAILMKQAINEQTIDRLVGDNDKNAIVVLYQSIIILDNTIFSDIC